jgi:hypothetical protein
MDDSAARGTDATSKRMPLWIAWAAAIPLLLAAGEAGWQAIQGDSLAMSIRAVGLASIASFAFSYVRSLPRTELSLSVTKVLGVLGVVAVGVSAFVAIVMAMR